MGLLDRIFSGGEKPKPTKGAGAPGKPAVPGHSAQQARPTIGGIARRAGSAGPAASDKKLEERVVSSFQDDVMQELWGSLSKFVATYNAAAKKDHTKADTSAIGSSAGALLGQFRIVFDGKKLSRVSDVDKYYKTELNPFLDLLKSSNTPVAVRKILEKELLKFIDDLTMAKNQNDYVLAQYILKDLGESAPKDQDSINHDAGFNQSAMQAKLNGDYSGSLRTLNQLLGASKPDADAVDVAAQGFLRSFQSAFLMQAARESAGEMYGESIVVEFRRGLFPYLQALQNSKLPAGIRKSLERHMMEFVDELIQEGSAQSSLLVRFILNDLEQSIPRVSDLNNHHAGYDLGFVVSRLSNLGAKVHVQSSAIGTEFSLKASMLGVQDKAKKEATADEIAEKQKAVVVEQFNLQLSEFNHALDALMLDDLRDQEKLRTISERLRGLGMIAEKDRANELKVTHEECVARYARVLVEKAKGIENLGELYAVFTAIHNLYPHGKLPDTEEFKPVRAFARTIADGLVKLPGAEALENAKYIYRILGLKGVIGDLEFRELEEEFKKESPLMSNIRERIHALAENKAWLDQTDGLMSNKDKLEGYLVRAVELELIGLCDKFSVNLQDSSLMNTYKKLYGESSIEIRCIYHRILTAFALKNNLRATKNLLEWIEVKDPQSHTAALQFDALAAWLGAGHTLEGHSAVERLSDKAIATTIDLRELHNILAASFFKMREADVPTVMSLVELLYGRGVINPTLIEDMDEQKARDALEFFRLCIDALTRPEIYLQRNKEDSPLDDAFLTQLFTGATKVQDPVLRLKIGNILYEYGRRLLADDKLIEANRERVEENSGYFVPVKDAPKRKEPAHTTDIFKDASRFLQCAVRLGNDEALKELKKSKDPEVKAVARDLAGDPAVKAAVKAATGVRRLEQRSVKKAQATQRKAEAAARKTAAAEKKAAGTTGAKSIWRSISDRVAFWQKGR